MNDNIQKKLISLRELAGNEEEFVKLVWAHGLQEYLLTPTRDPIELARREFRRRKGLRHLSANTAFLLAVDCLKNQGAL